MVTDGQVRKLRRLLSRGERLAVSAWRTGMDEKTARKYRDSEGLPSQRTRPRTWRTRLDPFVDIWPEVQERLEAEPRLRAVTLWGWLEDRYPGRFAPSQRRTFERRVRHWRARHGRGREVMFPQVHAPGGLGASDFTSMNSLRVTIAGQPFDHLLYHFTLTYSNWESVTICFSESFEALSRGLQEAFWRLGGVPGKHRSDSLSAAVNNLSEDREFRGRYRDLLEYYQVEPQRINVRQAHENGDVESSHGHFKTAVDQALLLRGGRDFASREEYERFLARLIDKRNASRAARLAEEEACLGELPPGRLDHRQRVSGVPVRSSSTIQVKRNTYSVPSRLIGYTVDVVIDADFVEVFYAGAEVQRMPRLTGSGKHAINYRHVIDSLVRKPGAFENYQYREDMFPTSHFRIAYDELCHDHGPRQGVREYLKILQLAARDSQEAVQEALRGAITRGEAISSKAVQRAVEQHQQAPPVTDVNVEPPDLDAFDSLLQHPDMEVDNHEYNHDESGPSPATADHDQQCPAGEVAKLFSVRRTGGLVASGLRGRRFPSDRRENCGGEGLPFSTRVPPCCCPAERRGPARKASASPNAAAGSGSPRRAMSSARPTARRTVAQAMPSTGPSAGRCRPDGTEVAPAGTGSAHGQSHRCGRPPAMFRARTGTRRGTARLRRRTAAGRGPGSWLRSFPVPAGGCVTARRTSESEVSSPGRAASADPSGFLRRACVH